jgi:putative hydrolase of the HAD superfamily
VKVLLIDLDDTLLDYSGGVDECWLSACTAHATPIGLDAAAVMAAILRTRRWFWGDPDRHRRERTQMLGAWRKIVAGALEEIGVRSGDLAACIAEDFAERRWARMALFPGARETLRELRRRGIPLALVTNGDASHQRRKIAQHDLAQFFDAIVIEGEFGVGKPDESVYRHALSTLGASPSEAWMVGDNLEWDVAAPQRLGLGGIWIDAEGRGVPAPLAVVPRRIIKRFAELASD